MAAVIKVDRLRKAYGDTVAVDDLSFSVERGEIFGILGPNDAGKTTTVECIELFAAFARKPVGGPWFHLDEVGRGMTCAGAPAQVSRAAVGAPPARVRRRSTTGRAGTRDTAASC